MIVSFEAFRWNISLSANLLFLKSEIQTIILSTVKNQVCFASIRNLQNEQVDKYQPSYITMITIYATMMIYYLCVVARVVECGKINIEQITQPSLSCHKFYFTFYVKWNGYNYLSNNVCLSYRNKMKYVSQRHHTYLCI